MTDSSLASSRELHANNWDPGQFLRRALDTFADPIFINDNGDLIHPADPDIVAAVNVFAEDRLADLGWDWTEAEGGCGTVWIDVEGGTYQVEAYKRRVVMQAHLMSGSLAPDAQGNART